MADSKKYISPVPTDYQEVEYIQSSGNGEYIDIDYTPTINTKFELDFAFVSSSYSQSDSIPVMGERSGATASDTNKFALWVHKQNGRETLNFGSYDSGFQTATNASLRNVTSNDKAKLYYNGTFVSGDDSAILTSGNLSIYLFALNDNGALLNRNNVMKVYNMKLYESGTLVRDLIPCYRKTDNVAGLYDTINDVFYTNQGSGSISAGVDVNMWLHSLRKLTTATEAVENPLYSDGTAITSYTISGNTVQNGTPSPSNPVDVNGVGVRTENLFNTFDIVGRVPSTGNGALVNYNGSTTSFIPINSGNVVVTKPKNILIYLMLYAANGDYIGYDIANAGTTINGSNISGYENARLARLRIDRTTGLDDIQIMLNTGSTAKPYEPYGYKIPISSGGVTTNIYLGSTQTTRQIKKLVLTGGSDELWTNTTIDGLYRERLENLPRAAITECVCSHYKYRFANDDGNVFVNSTLYQCTFCDNVNAVDDTTWRTYLANQYANGTPVTVWYVLATPTTAAVNEPLMKIGDYADTLSNATSIPTTEGANSITVDTTVQPSEFTATWTGWHDASVKEYDSNYSIAMMQALTIAQLQTHTISELQGGWS